MTQSLVTQRVTGPSGPQVLVVEQLARGIFSKKFIDAQIKNAYLD